MKQFVRFFIMAALILAVSCKKEEVIAVTGISVTPNSLTIKEGESATLSATITPSDAANQRVEWSSSNDDVAVVTAGKVIGRAAGNATITVRSEDGGKTATCAVKVESATISVVSVSLDKESLELTEGDSAELTATVKPDDASNKKVSWSSSDSSIATVENGKVTALKAGTAKITVTTDDGGKTATCEVTVNAAIVPVSGVSLDETSLELVEGETFTLTATISPDDASNKNVSWSSSDSSVAKVEDGKITAVKAGSAKITVTTEDGNKVASCGVTVKAAIIAVSAISLDQTSLELIEGESATLTATIEPENASNKNYSWESSDAEIASVKDGKVTAVKAGTATITVKSEDGGKTASCKVTVTPAPIPVTEVTLDVKSLTLTPGATARLTATVMPEDADNKNVSWKSSDTSIATVENGKVTAVKIGSAKITVTTEDGGKTATCDVTVKTAKISVTGISLNKSSIKLIPGDSFTLTATITPSNATDKSVSWSVSDNKYISATSSGMSYTLKALELGSVTVTVTTNDGNKTAKCTVDITPFKGNGTSADPYQLSTVEDMKRLSDYVNSGTTFEGKYFRLTNGLTYGIAEVPVIGKDTDHHFSGNLNGSNLTIKYTAKDGSSYLGLFGYLSNATIENLNVDVDIQGDDTVGGIAAVAADATIRGCNITGNIRANKTVGGLVGMMRTGKIENCKSKATIVATYGNVGGLCGNSRNAKMENCEASGNVSGNYNVGGLVGSSIGNTMTAYIFKCKSSNRVTGVKPPTKFSTVTNIGGIIGQSQIDVISCVASVASEVSTTDGTNVGGIVGKQTGRYVVGCYSQGKVTADTGSSSSGIGGGIVGENTDGRIISCHFVTDKTSDLSGTTIGGIAGKTTNGSIENCWTGTFAIFGSYAGTGLGNNQVVTQSNIALWKNGTALNSLNTGIDNINGKGVLYKAAVKYITSTSSGFPIIKFE